MEYDNRSLENTNCIFDTHGQDSKLKEYDKTTCKVIKRKPTSEYDFEDIGTMWEVVLADGTNVDAFPDELS